MSDKAPEGTALGRAFLDRAKTHFAKDGIVPVPVPELSQNGTPFTIYVSPMSPEQKDKISRASTDKKTGITNDGLFSALAVIAKAKDEHGERIFTRGDLSTLMEETDTQIVGRIAQAIFGKDEVKSVLDKPDGLPPDADLDDVLERS